MPRQRFHLSRKLFRAIQGLGYRGLWPDHDGELERFFVGTLERETRRLGWIGVPYVWWNTIIDMLFRRGRLTAMALRGTNHRSFLGGLGEEARLGARYLLRRPGFALSVIATLAVGLGANIAMFTLLHTILVRPLPFPEPDHLVRLWSENEALKLEREGISPADLLDLEEANTTLQSIAGWFMTSGTYQEPTYAEELISAQVTGDFFAVLGVDAAVGRTFAASDMVDAFGPAVISHAFWWRRFGGDSNVVGRRILISGDPVEVVGIMPEDFTFPSREVDLWLAWDLRRGYAYLGEVPRTWRFLNVIGRADATPHAGRVEIDLQRVAAHLESTYPVSNRGWTVRTLSLHEETVADARPALLLGFGAVGFLLFLTCVNVANMLLARLPARTNELVVRAALGADSWRLLRHLFVEVAMLASVATGVGLVIAVALVHLVTELNVSTLPRIEQTAIHGASLLFAVGLMTAVTFVCGLMPAIHVARSVRTTPDRARQVGHTKKHQRVQNVLVVSQLAIAVVLLVGATLFAESLRRLRSSDLGYDDSNVLTYRLSLDARPGEAGYIEPYYRAVIDSMGALPSVSSAGASTTLPLDPVGNDFNRPFRLPGEQTSSAESPKAQMRIVTPGFFETLRLPFRSGRPFSGRERVGEPRVVIVNEQLARQRWPDVEPVGQRLMIDFRDGWQPYTVVGVIANIQHYGARTAAKPELFVPASQIPYLAMSVVVRTTNTPELLIPAVQRVLRSINPRQPPHNFSTLHDLRSASLAEDRFLLMVFSVFAGVAVMLAATGVYGMMAFTVSQRTREIGVRVALGARPSVVARSIFRKAMTLAGIGIVVGTLTALLLGRVIEDLLYSVSVSNNIILLGVGLLLLGIACAGAALPAKRSTRINPIEALRAE